ncbi:MAG: hypothetical protein ABI443_09360 [Chthoniobacterales bacterium]
MSEQSGIGASFPAEWKEMKDLETGRQLTQLTSAKGASYPLYYFVPSITKDGRYLIFHSERSGWVQLYRLDLTSGAIVQLTDGRTSRSGWGIWCERRLRGIYNHLSTLDTAHNEVFYFQDDEIRATHVETIENRLVAKLPPGRIPMGQTAFSNDGSLFAFIHADEKKFNQMLDERDAAFAMRVSSTSLEMFRELGGDITLGVIDTKTGSYREVITTDYLFHHVLFLDDQTLLINHPKGCHGMWTVDLSGKNIRNLRPHTAPGAHNAQICHQVLTKNGILYEANHRGEDGHKIYIGRYQPETDSFEEVLLPVGGYIHVGSDPLGEFTFIEVASGTHEIRSVHFPRDPAKFNTRLLRTLGPVKENQRNHAHPFLTPDRKSMIFTDLSENGYNQIYRMDVSDLTSLEEYW